MAIGGHDSITSMRPIRRYHSTPQEKHWENGCRRTPAGERRTFLVLPCEHSMTNRDQIVEQALSLAPEDRAFVADALEQSLSGGSFVSTEIAAAWAEEIGQRLAAYDRGDIQAADADVALVRLRHSSMSVARRRCGLDVAHPGSSRVGSP